MEENISQKEKEKAEEEMIEQAFQELLNDYLATKHRFSSSPRQVSMFSSSGSVYIFFMLIFLFTKVGKRLDFTKFVPMKKLINFRLDDSRF